MTYNVICSFIRIINISANVTVMLYVTIQSPWQLLMNNYQSLKGLGTVNMIYHINIATDINFEINNYNVTYIYALNTWS